MEHLQNAIAVIASLHRVNARIFFPIGFDVKLVWKDQAQSHGESATITNPAWKCLGKVIPENTIGNVKFQGNDPLSQALTTNKIVPPNVPFRLGPESISDFATFGQGSKLH